MFTLIGLTVGIITDIAALILLALIIVAVPIFVIIKLIELLYRKIRIS